MRVFALSGESTSWPNVPEAVDVRFQSASNTRRASATAVARASSIQKSRLVNSRAVLPPVPVRTRLPLPNNSVLPSRTMNFAWSTLWLESKAGGVTFTAIPAADSTPDIGFLVLEPTGFGPRLPPPAPPPPLAPEG